MARYTTHQILTLVEQTTGRALSRERLRQLRVGYTERRARLDGSVYVREHPPVLQEGVDWRWERTEVIYTTAGVRRILERYSVSLTPELKTQLGALPRAKKNGGRRQGNPPENDAPAV